MTGDFLVRASGKKKPLHVVDPDGITFCGRAATADWMPPVDLSPTCKKCVEIDAAYVRNRFTPESRRAFVFVTPPSYVLRVAKDECELRRREGHPYEWSPSTRAVMGGTLAVITSGNTELYCE